MLKMISRSFLLLFLLVSLSSFLWDGDEKDLGVLCAKAKKSLEAHAFEEAAEEYQKILRRFDVHKGGKNALGWQSYIDCCLNLVNAWIELEEWEKAQAQLLSLELKAPPAEYLPRIRLVQARIETRNQDPGAAFTKMCELMESFPNVTWSPQETAFFQALRYTLDQEYEDLLRKGKRLAKAGFHREALPLFQKVLEGVKMGYFPRARGSQLLEKYLHYLIAESHYSLADYEASLDYLSIDFDEERLDYEMLYLSALCYKEKALYEKSVQCFHDYIEKGKGEVEEHYVHALFELGYYAFSQKQYEKAQHYFVELLPFLKKGGRPAQLGVLYLAKTYLEQKNENEALTTLLSLNRVLSTKSPLQSEIAYLRGEIAFKQQAFQEAAQYFARSLKERENGVSRQKAQYHLALCHLKQSDSPSLSKSRKKELLTEAEKSLLSLIRSPLSESALIALTQTYQAQSNLLEDHELSTKALSLLRKEANTDTLKLLLVEITPDFSEKESLLQELLHESKPPQIRSKAFQLQGIQLFERGEIAQAIEAFESGLTAERALEVSVIHTLCSKETMEERPLLKKLHEELKKEDLSNLGHEQLYVLGLLSFSIDAPHEETIHIFEKFIESYPSSPFRDPVFLMAAKTLFNKGDLQRADYLLHFLITHSPCSPHLPEAHYTLLKIRQSTDNNTSSLEKELMELIEKCPSSLFSSLAYFEFYPFETYLEGNLASINHLLAFETLFPDSELNIVAHALLGENASQTEKKRWHWTRSFHFFELCTEKRKTCPYIKQAISSQLALAQLLIRETQEPHEALTILNKLSRIEPLEGETRKKVQLLQVECYYQTKQVAEAQKKLNDLIKTFKQDEITQSPLLSKAWELQGDLALESEVTCALKNYECALIALTEDELSTPRALQLRLKMSQCYTSLGLFDQAMRSLSNIINADVASPLRIEAMVRRAEIYSLQKRPELAMRQLESAAKYGGEWGAKAQQQLEEIYGLEHY
jgi:tetratricopeptide (TPR) repeat protein